MSRHTLEGNPPIEVSLRRSTRARRLSLRVSRLDGRVSLTLPQMTLDREGIAFLQSKESWLRSHLEQLQPVRTVAIGEAVMFRGQLVPVILGAGRRVLVTDEAIEVPSTDKVGLKIKAQFKQLARNELARASDHYARRLGKSYNRLSIRDTRSRWGSCSSAGGLMYSWRLIMAPKDVLNYVAAHEVAHLVEMNHSSAFWTVVQGLDPNYTQSRQWLRDHGDQLHRVTFNN